MRKISIFFLITILAFGLNGCILDRIKQRQYAKQMLEQQSVQTNNSKAVVVEKFQKRVYTPSSSPLVAQERVVYKKRKVVKKKRVQKSSRKKVVKSKHKRVKKYHKKIKKIQKEPYSIGDEESDPELLGPQTTLESNPLAKNSAKVENDKKL